jgi:hypothetical protein
MQAARLLLQFVLGIGLTYALQRWDFGRLPAPQRERAWNSATWGAAVFWFGPLSMLGWGWVTRRGKGLLLGLACVVGLSLVLRGVDVAFAWLLDLPFDPNGAG